MAIKKTISTKSTPASAGKTPAKKIAVKKAPVKKAAAPKKVASPKKAVKTKKAVSAKKTAAPKKAATAKKVAAPKKAAKKAVEKTIKKLPAKLLAKTSANGKAKSAIEKNAIQLLVDAAVEGVLEVKGRNICVLDLKNIHNRVCDYYIICQADSSTQVNAIAGSVEEMVKKRIGERPYHTEGFQNSEWILVDYVNVVVHVFQSHIREFYNLEALWADAEVTKIAFD